MLDKQLQCLFGYHLMQLSVSREIKLFEQSVIRHKFSLGPLGDKNHIAAVTALDNLPIESDSVDVALLHHVLEFSDNPHQLLRDASRVIVPHGHMMITGFNPLSLFGLRIRGSRHLQSVLAQSQLLSVKRVLDWLALLEFTVESVNYSCFYLPWNRESLIRRFDALDAFCERRNLPVGGVYQIHASKRRVAMTPTRSVWQLQRPKIPAVTLAKPSVRNTTIH